MVDRARIAQLGLTERDVTNALATALAGTGADRAQFLAQSQERRLLRHRRPDAGIQAGLAGGAAEPAGHRPAAAAPQVLGALGTFSRTQPAAVVTHYNILPTIDLYATTQDRDLGAVARGCAEGDGPPTSKYLPRGATVTLRGQIVTMNTAFSGLFFGLVGAIVLIYLLIVVNFQSWIDPFVIITALARGAGRHRLDAVRHRHHLVGAGADRRHHVHGRGHRQLDPGGQLRARAAGRHRRCRCGRRWKPAFTRFRPVLMTALAMIIGMAPMALGLGEGGEQNAPLGRAVIGGLIFATCATLMFVPVVFSIVHGRKAAATQERAHPSLMPETAMPDRRNLCVTSPTFCATPRRPG